MTRSSFRRSRIDARLRRHVGLPIAAALLAAVAGCGNNQAGKPDVVAGQDAIAAQAQAEQSAVERGKYLVTVMACGDCHTPWKMGPKGPEPDESRMLSGHPADLTMPPLPPLKEPWMWAGAATNTAFSGPWGVSYAVNLTPDNDTGIGLWSEQVFVNSMKTGRHMGVGRPILPPMPWPAFGQMTDEDLKGMFAYLKTIEPKKNKAPEPIVNQPPAEAPPTPSAPAGRTQ